MKAALAICAVVMFCAEVAPASEAKRFRQLEATVRVSRSNRLEQYPEEGLSLILTITNRGPAEVEFFGWLNRDLHVVSPGSWEVVPPPSSDRVVITGCGSFSSTKLVAGESGTGWFALPEYFTKVTAGRNHLELLIDIHRATGGTVLRRFKAEVEVSLSRKSAEVLNAYFRKRRQRLGI